MTDFDPLQSLRQADPQRYAALLYTPEGARPALATLHLFDLELARIPSLVKEPMAGEIRLQWWREVISGERAGEGRSNPLGAALLDTVAAHDLSLSGFGMMLDGRIADLYDDPFNTRTDLEAYLGQTRSALFQLLLQIVAADALGRSADASGHAGCAWGIGQILCRAAMDRGRGRVRLPEDILASAGGTTDEWLRAEDEAFLARAAAAMTALGEEHLTRARSAIRNLPKEARSAYLPLASTSVVLKRAARAGGELSRTPLHVPPLRHQWALLRMATVF